MHVMGMDMHVMGMGMHGMGMDMCGLDMGMHGMGMDMQGMGMDMQSMGMWTCMAWVYRRASSVAKTAMANFELAYLSMPSRRYRYMHIGP